MPPATKRRAPATKRATKRARPAERPAERPAGRKRTSLRDEATQRASAAGAAAGAAAAYVPSHAARNRVIWYGGLTALAALDVLDWPVAAVVAAGSYVAEQRAKSAMRGRGTPGQAAG